MKEERKIQIIQKIIECYNLTVSENPESLIYDINEDAEYGQSLSLNEDNDVIDSDGYIILLSSDFNDCDNSEDIINVFDDIIGVKTETYHNVEFPEFKGE